MVKKDSSKKSSNKSTKKKSSKKVSAKSSKKTLNKNVSNDDNKISEVNNCTIENMIKNDDLFFDNERSIEIDEKKIKKLINTENRISKNLLTKYELVRIIGERTKQLKMGAKPLVKNYTGLSYEEISKEEIKNNMIPFKIKRPIGDKYEIWKLDELKKDHLMIYLN